MLRTFRQFSQINTIRDLILDIQKMVGLSSVKDLLYFKNLIRLHDLSTIKQILPFIIQKQTEPILNHQKFLYIPTKSFAGCEAGLPISSKIPQVSEIFQVIIYRVSKHVDFILHKLYFTENPLLKGCKPFQKLQFYLSCKIISLNFNQKVFSFGDRVEGVFHVLSGQLRVQQKRSNKPIKRQIQSRTLTNNVTKVLLQAGCFAGFEEFISCSYSRKSDLISNQNGTSLLVIKTDILNRYLQIKYSKIPKEDQDIQPSLIPSEQNKILYKQFFSRYLFRPQQVQIELYVDQKHNLVQKSQQNKKNLSSVKFLRKMDRFTKENNLSTSNQNLKKLIHGKSLILRLKQSTEFSKKKFSQSQKQNIFLIRKMLQGPKIKSTKVYLKESEKMNKNPSIQQQIRKTTKRQDLLTENIKKRLKVNSFSD